MRIAKGVVATAALAALAGSALAQGPDMTPPAELKKLEWLLGEWTGGGTWTMEGQTMETKGWMKVEWEGQFLKATMGSDMMGMEFAEVSYMGWDAASKKFVSWTFTNFAPSPRIERGDIDGDRLVMLSEPWAVGGVPYTSRATIVRKGNSFEFTLEFKLGDSWVKVSDGKFTKKA